MLAKSGVRDRPRAPDGWEHEADLVRIVDKSGGAAAWIAPRYGANCVGYAVRRPRGWVQVLHVQSPQLLRVRPSSSGCAVLFPFPGHVRDARYRWAGVDYDLAPAAKGQRRYAHGFARTEAWRVVSLSADAVSLELLTRQVAPQIATAYPFEVRVCLGIRLLNGGLQLTLEATNLGVNAAPVGLGLHPYLAPELFDGDRTAIRIDMPGTSEHVLGDGIPTGERRRAAPAPITPPAHGETLLVARTGLGEPAVTTLSSAHNRAYITVASTGCRDIVVYAPDDRPSVAVEPHSCAPGAASQLEGHPDALVSLAPGATARLTTTLRVGDA